MRNGDFSKLAAHTSAEPQAITPRGRVTRWLVGIAIAMGDLAIAHPLLAQGCALCYNTAAAAGGRGIAALRNGILILMIPPVIIFGAVCFFTLRGRNRFNDEVEGFEQSRGAVWLLTQEADGVSSHGTDLS